MVCGGEGGRTMRCASLRNSSAGVGFMVWDIDGAFLAERSVFRVGVRSDIVVVMVIGECRC